MIGPTTSFLTSPTTGKNSPILSMTNSHDQENKMVADTMSSTMIGTNRQAINPAISLARSPKASWAISLVSRPSLTYNTLPGPTSRPPASSMNSPTTTPPAGPVSSPKNNPAFSAPISQTTNPKSRGKNKRERRLGLLWRVAHLRPPGSEHPLDVAFEYLPMPIRERGSLYEILDRHIMIGQRKDTQHQRRTREFTQFSILLQRYP